PPPPPSIYTLSLHDALPICSRIRRHADAAERPLAHPRQPPAAAFARHAWIDELVADRRAFRRDCARRRGRRSERLAERRRIEGEDRKSTRLNSSHRTTSYAV